VILNPEDCAFPESFLPFQPLIIFPSGSAGTETARKAASAWRIGKMRGNMDRIVVACVEHPIYIRAGLAGLAETSNEGWKSAADMILNVMSEY
jgi:hypothetical protein